MGLFTRKRALPDTEWRPDGNGVTIWAYAVFGADDRFEVGIRYQYTSALDPEWAYTGYEGDPWGEVYDDADSADEEARGLADHLAYAADGAAQREFPSVFDWDGQPMPLAAQDAGWDGASS